MNTVKETVNYQGHKWPYASIALRGEFKDNKQLPEVFFKIDALKNLCWSLLLMYFYCVFFYQKETPTHVLS